MKMKVPTRKWFKVCLFYEKLPNICIKLNGGWRVDNFECMPAEMINDSSLEYVMHVGRGRETITAKWA